MTQQIGEPFTVAHIRLASRHRLDVLRIDQQDATALLEQSIDRIPLHPGRFHREVVDLHLRQPGL
jgi:hypothetical protein